MKETLIVLITLVVIVIRVNIPKHYGNLHYVIGALHMLAVISVSLSH